MPAIAALGFPYYLGFTSSSAYTPAAGEIFNFQQRIESDMVSDFAWGTAGAQPVILSFWAFSSQAGMLGGSIRNDTATRSYPFSFSLLASTWTKIVITIPGDTTPGWTMFGGSYGLSVVFDLGSASNMRGPAGVWAGTNYVGVTGAVSVVGTNAATFNVTGVKLEIGSIATPFNRQSLAKSMADCQRYYSNTVGVWFQAYSNAGQNIGQAISFPMMRAAPTITFTNVSSSNCTDLAVAVGPTLSSVALNVTASVMGNATFATVLVLSAEL